MAFPSGPRPNQNPSLMPNFNSGAAYAPTFTHSNTEFNMPPSASIGAGLRRAAAPSSLSGGLLDRAAGLGSAAIALPGLLQEGATRALSALTGGGGAEPMPSDLLHRWGVLGDNSFDQFATNLVLDPFNLVLGGVPFKLGKGLDRARELEMLIQKEKPLRELVLDAGMARNSLLFTRPEQLDDLMLKAGISLPRRQHEVLKSWYVDYTGVASPKLVRQQLRQAMENENLVVYDANMGLKKQYKVDELPRYKKDFSIQGWEKVTDQFKEQMKQPWDYDGLKRGEERSLWVKIFGTPQNYSPFLKGQVKSYEQGNEVFHNHRKDFSDFVINNTQPFDLYQGRKSDQNRALLYLLKGDQRLLEGDVKAKAAYEANKLKIDQSVGSLKARIFEELQGFDFETKLTRKKIMDAGTSLEDLKSVGFNDKTWQWLTGITLDEHSADPVAHLLGMQRRLGKERFLKPTEKALVAEREAMFKDGRMLQREKEYSEMLSRAFTGQEASLVDKELQKLIINNKDTLRGMSLNRKFNWLSKQTEGLIAGAESGKSTTAKVTEKLRRTTYASLLGFGIDSSVRNVVGGTLNTLTEYGFRTFENIIPAFKAATDKRWRETLDLKNVLNHSNSMMEEWFQKTPFIPENATFMERAKKAPGQTMYDVAMSPMQMTENFNRALAYFTALDHNIKVGGLPVGEAIRAAEEATKKLHFGYSNIDVSPYLNNPTARIFSQFMIYPFRQMELLGKWSKEGKGLNNKLARYLMLTGAALNHGTRHGIDMTNVLGIGLGFSEYPGYLRYRGDGVAPHLTMTAPVIKLMGGAMNGAKNFMDAMWTGATGQPIIDQEYSPNKAWSDFGDFMRLLVPGGRYGSKVAKNYTEFTANGDPTKQWADMATFVGARYDPSVNGTDRILSLLGFAPTSEQMKRDQIKFLQNFKTFYMDSVASLNEKVMKGQDYQKLQAKLQKRIATQYGPQLERMGVRISALRSIIRPSETATLNRNRRNLTSTPAEAFVSKFPKVMKGMDLDLFP